MLHVTCTQKKLGRFLTFSGRESNCQFDSWPFFWPSLVFQMSKWVMQTHFRHPRSKSSPMIKITFQTIEFFLLQSPSKDLGVHWDSIYQNGSYFGSVRVHSLTLSYTFGSMQCDSRGPFWPTTLQAPFTTTKGAILQSKYHCKQQRKKFRKARCYEQ
jgi:hypothetical protein